MALLDQLAGSVEAQRGLYNGAAEEAFQVAVPCNFLDGPRRPDRIACGFVDTVPIQWTKCKAGDTRQVQRTIVGPGFEARRGERAGPM